MKKLISMIMVALLLLSACSSSTLDGAGKELEDTAANVSAADNINSSPSGGSLRDLSYQGTSLIDLLGCPPVQLYEAFGAPTSGTPVDGASYLGGEYYGYDGMMFLIDYSTSKIAWIMGAAEAVEIKGVTLDKSRTELVEILGVPSSEEDYYDETGDFEDCYLIEYIDKDGGVSLLIEMPDADSNSERITLSIYDDDAVDDSWDDFSGIDDSESNWESYVSLDSNLYGRWRENTGSAWIILDEYGSASTNLYIDPSITIGNPEYAVWEAVNGSLKITGTYQFDMEYLLSHEHLRDHEAEVESGDGTMKWKDGRETIWMYDAEFVRRAGTPEGTGIVGEWCVKSRGDDSIPFYIFNADGTGITHSTDPMTWTADDEMIYTRYQLSRVWDYSVSGDTLLLFFSDGARTFTRVGD